MTHDGSRLPGNPRKAGMTVTHLSTLTSYTMQIVIASEADDRRDCTRFYSGVIDAPSRAQNTTILILWCTCGRDMSRVDPSFVLVLRL